VGTASAGRLRRADPDPVLAGSGGVPDHQPSPPRFAVAPFENRLGAQAFDWLVAGAPFEVAEKTEDVLGLVPTGGPLHVGAARVGPEAGAVAALAAAQAAGWVVTGWVDRPKWLLQIHLVLWRAAGPTAVPVATAERTGDSKAYHRLLGEAVAEIWRAAGVPVSAAQAVQLGRPLASDLYAVTLLGRGLGHLTGALAGSPSLPAAEQDLERAVFIDPKCHEAQRVLGELYLARAADPKADPRLAGRAAGKLAYASDLAPTSIGAMRAAGAAAARAGKHEVARDLARRLVTRQPWDLEARLAYGSALWHTGDAAAAERQLDQVVAQRPDHLAARRVLALIHAARGDTARLVTELEAIAARAPADLDVKADLATAYGALGQWRRAATALEQIAAARPRELALLVRVGDAHRRRGDLAAALAWYARGAQVSPESSYAGFASAQALFDAGRLAEAAAAYTQLLRFRADAGAAEQALATIALARGQPDEAAWHARRAAREAPRSVLVWRTLAAAELARRDLEQALTVLDRALWAWPRDARLLYVAGVARAQRGDRALARMHLLRTLEVAPGHAAASAAISALDVGGAVALAAVHELWRPWGDAAALDEALARYAAISAELASARAAYQHLLLGQLGALGKGPAAAARAAAVRRCPAARIAPLWGDAQRELRRYERLGAELEVAYRFIARHDEIGATAALLPGARARVAAARVGFRTALADVGELRAAWDRTLAPELRAVGCYDQLLAAAYADPERYRVIQEDRAVPAPTARPPAARAPARATLYVDNARCSDPVEVFIDGASLGQVAPGRRSALVADGGERTLCLIVPGAAQCGDRGTVRQVYLHDGWSAVMHCAP
jgi:Flp pilus assembly protein TadD